MSILFNPVSLKRSGNHFSKGKKRSVNPVKKIRSHAPAARRDAVALPFRYSVFPSFRYSVIPQRAHGKSRQAESSVMYLQIKSATAFPE